MIASKMTAAAALVAAAAGTVAAQTVLLAEDFDGATPTIGPGFTTSVTDAGGSSSDYFRVTDGSDISGTYLNATGNFFAAQDIDGIAGVVDNGFGGQGASRQQLRFDNIDVSGFQQLVLSFSAAESDAADGNEDWDLPDLVHASFVFDGVPPTDGDTGYSLWFDSMPNDTEFNAAPWLNSDFDGDGGDDLDDVPVTSTFASFSDLVNTNGALTASLVITFDLNAGDEDFAIDDIVVTGLVPTPGAPMVALLAAAPLMRRRR